MSTGASLRPDNAATGGFLDATNATIASARFIDAYPNGTPSLLLEVTFQPEEGKARTELYRGGSIDQIRPTADGKGTAPNEARMRSDSGAMKLISSVIDGGFDVSKLGSDISVFVGTKVFLRRKPVPQYKLKDGTMSKGGDILLVEKVLEMPGEAPAKKVVAKPAAKAAAPKPVKAAAAEAPPAQEVAEETTTVDAELESIISALLAAAPDHTIALNRVGSAVFKVVMTGKQHPQKAPLMALASKKEWLSAEARPWVATDESIIGYAAEAA